MNAGISVCFYLLIGIAVAVALWLGRDLRAGSSDMFQVLSAPLFWPIYLPILLSRRTTGSLESALERVGEPNQYNKPDAMASAITQVECELDAALQSLDGWAENVLADEQLRINELKNAWHQQAGHIRELDRLLDKTAQETATPVTEGAAATAHPDQQIQSRISEHERSRSENIARLKQLRGLMFDDLMGTVAWVRELVTMIHVAKYTGAPASRAQELVQQIAATVECLSELQSAQK